MKTGDYLAIGVVGALAGAAAVVRATNGRWTLGSRAQILGDDHVRQGQKQRQRRLDEVVRRGGFHHAMRGLIELEQGANGRGEVRRLVADHRYLVSKHGRGSRSVAQQADPFRAALIEVLALLRSLHWDTWTGHWTVQGPTFYADHLLLQRLYSEELPEQIDGFAERMVAAYGPDAVASEVLADRLASLARRWAKIRCPIRRALAAEQELQRALASAYALGKGRMSLGMDDELMGLANAHDTAIYLLGQRLRGEHACGEGTCRSR